LACGWEGKGRLPSTEIIVSEIEKALTPHDLKGENVLVTAGPTREYIDPVRFISNPSSGKMGFAVASAAWKRGAEVILVTGPTNIDPLHGIKTIVTESAEQMHQAVTEHADWASIVVKAAAVGDYLPKSYAKDKISKTNGTLNLELTKTKDILSELGKNKNGKLLVGFAAETNDIINKGKTKLKEKNLDIMVVNDVTKEGAGFSVDTNSAYILSRKGDVKEFGIIPKQLLAQKILDEIVEINSMPAG
nr:bifunctional phosphopantothenoylcysteine decarboxylase/phosphopantothenate--cysteine ligase CoaBC [Candidatus Dadabacteria bacterium]